MVVLNWLDKMENKLCVMESKIEPSIGTRLRMMSHYKCGHALRASALVAVSGFITTVPSFWGGGTME